MAIISELPKGYIDVEDAARVIGVSYSQCCRYIEAGLLPARQIGFQRFVRERDALSFERPPRGNPAFRRQKRTA